MSNYKNEFIQEDTVYTEPAEKVGIAATINEQGLPHLTLLTSIQALGTNELTVGEFCWGTSKHNMEKNRRIGFLIMTLDKRILTGKASWKEKRTHGEEFEKYNSLPMFRYNSYFGINTVHYFDLKEVSRFTPLPMGKIIASTLKTRIAANQFKKPGEEEVLNYFSHNLINKIDSLNFISYISDDGYPVIIPVIQSLAPNRSSIIFNTSVFRKELDLLTVNSDIALLSMNLDMESVLLRGKFRKSKKTISGRTGIIDLNWVYNSMPPQHRQIYPEQDLKPIENF